MVPLNNKSVITAPFSTRRLRRHAKPSHTSGGPAQARSSSVDGPLAMSMRRSKLPRDAFQQRYEAHFTKNVHRETALAIASVTA